MANKPYKRRILLIHSEVQMAIILYAVICAVLGSFFSLIITSYWLRTETIEWDAKWVFLIGGGFTLFLFMIILGLYLTNRICGPLFQLQRQIQAAVRGEKAVIYTRKGDYFGPLMEDANQLLAQIQKRDKND